MHGFIFWLRFLHILNPAIPDVEASTFCKAIPNTPQWPSAAAWSQLNDSISGNLLKPLPPGAVCDPALPVFNNASCAKVLSQYGFSTFHANDPVSVDWPNYEYDACLPTSTMPCRLDQFPVYVVNASTWQHVKEGVDFARNHNIRLIVKGTGHDFLGRSTAPNSLSIWTHHYRGLEFKKTWTPPGCKKQYENVLEIGAGEQMRDIYTEMSKHNRVVVGGFDPNVGIGGFITGGGHSPISSAYGLASDHAIGFTVLTPDGILTTANECQNTDLFWAMKGGGGSTFGVLLTVTVQTLPETPVTASLFSLNSTGSNSDDFWSAIAYIHSQLPNISDAGLMGYTFLFHNPAEPGGYFFAWLMWMLNRTESDVAETLAPYQEKLANAPFAKGIVMGGYNIPAPSFWSLWSTYGLNNPGGVGGNSQIGSRLLGRKALTQDVNFIKEKLKAAMPPGPDGSLIGHLIAGKGVANAKPPGGFGATLPAWREAYFHAVTPISYPYYDPSARATQSRLLTYNYTAAYRALAPDTGCYLNEADINEPDLPHAFWGDNYARLLKIKRTIDPKGVFWGATSVGREDWKVNGKGQLCRT